jgi:hypothetical protein
MTDDEDSMIELIKQIHESQMNLDARLTTHMTQEPVEIAKAIASMVSSGFAGGDLVGHRLEHEAAISKTLEKAELYKKLRLELAKLGLFGLLSWAAYALWHAFLLGPSK